VTIVQYREKSIDTGKAIETAKKLLSICNEHNIPLLINDRIDVALAVDCAGVHIGQDDMGKISDPSSALRCSCLD
jgi:thiamine-phosphate diphosphorylase/hydroxyethylthiazole kinase